jgi:hypothetical protein
MQAVVKLYQQIIKNKLEVDLLRELLLDGGFSNIEDEIEFKFPEIDIENQIKFENHVISKWQNNLVTRTEARNEMDYDNTITDTDTFLRLVDIPKLEAQQEGQLEIAELNADNAIKLAKMTPKPTEGGSSGATALPKPGTGGHSITKVTHKVVGPSKNAKTTSNKVAPANQHGKKARPKYVKNNVDTNIFEGLSIFNKKTFYDTLHNDIKDQLLSHLDDTINKLCLAYHYDRPDIDQRLVDTYLDGMSLCLEDRVYRAAKMLDEDIKFKVFGGQTEEFIEDQFDKIDNLGAILLCKSLGFKTILITADECEEHQDTNIDISSINYTKIAPFGYKCACGVSSENFINDQ